MVKKLINSERKISKKDLRETLSPGKKMEEILNSLNRLIDYNDLIYLLMKRNN